MPSGKRIDWTFFDDLIKTELPRHTIEEFGRKFLPEISSKAIGARARKLGIKPSKYSPSPEHRAATGRGIEREITDVQHSYILANCTIKSRKAIAKDLGLTLWLVKRVLLKQGVIVPEETTARLQAEASKKHVAKAIAASQARWSDPAFKARRSAESSANNKKLWQSEKYRLKVRGGLRKAYATTDLIDRLSAIGKARYANDATVRDILHAA